MSSPKDILGKLAASVGAVAVILLLFRAAPFLGEQPVDGGESVEVTVPTSIAPMEPVEVLVRGLPFHSISRPIVDCVGERQVVGLAADCVSCQVLMDSRDGETPAVLWLEPDASGTAEWILRAELLTCHYGSTSGQLFSYRSEPGPARQTTGNRGPLPEVPGAREILRVEHPGWRLVVDEVEDMQAVEAATLDLLMRNWNLFRQDDKHTEASAMRLFQRGDEICILSQQIDSSQPYLISLYRRDASTAGEAS